ncbi:hypothetical protein F2P56_020574 [Juglans regia]|uniref:F-box domain-containing protein n=1 Tax=Juglans regia TaxID=51240 RepID=A0A833TIV5_JUGRE|nr:hypothetical protein F2P56_020574 [Juglans regia]
MGAGLSVFFSGITGSDCSNGSLSLQSKPSLGDLPESCVALVLASLDPPEICKLARLNRAFRGASWADYLWESKLPSNYQVLVRKVFGELPGDLGKREIYARLCQANSFDCDTKKFWLHKSTGGVCLSIASKGLSITGIDDRRYWSHIPTEESGRFFLKKRKSYLRWMMETPVVRGIPLLECVKVVLAPKKSFRWMMDTPTIPRILLLEFVKISHGCIRPANLVV